MSGHSKWHNIVSSIYTATTVDAFSIILAQLNQQRITKNHKKQ